MAATRTIAPKQPASAMPRFVEAFFTGLKLRLD
jgi:hypothetical protein